MNASNTVTAKLVFAGEHFVSLPKVADLLNTHLMSLGQTAPTRSEASLTGLRITSGQKVFTMDLAFEEGETILTIGLQDADAPSDMAALAAAVYPIAKTLPAEFVVWADTGVRIPRETFVQGLSVQFDSAVASEEESGKDKVVRIAPRRIKVSREARTSRPLAKPATPDRASSLAATPQTVQLASANDNSVMGQHRFDAHVLSFEQNLRSTMLRESKPEELGRLDAEGNVIPLEARLSTWAVSLTVATISLPVAAPVMIYNIARGEDMRVASLAMGLAGFFLALDTSGAMAAVTGF